MQFIRSQIVRPLFVIDGFFCYSARDNTGITG